MIVAVMTTVIVRVISLRPRGRTVGGVIDEMAWPPEPPRNGRARVVAIVIAIAVVTIAALVVTVIVWWPSTPHRHFPAIRLPGTHTSPTIKPSERAVTSSPAVEKAEASVVKVIGTAPSCSRRIEGSGFVYAADRVMTAAHVVAGVTGSPSVTTRQGRSVKATVVVFDPERDVAVLHAPGLTAPALSLRPRARTGDLGVIMGYPKNQTLVETPAKILAINRVRGSDLYHAASASARSSRCTARSRRGRAAARWWRRTAPCPGWSSRQLSTSRIAATRSPPRS
jgi:hypothetical protein